jgi:hypothetical protein
MNEFFAGFNIFLEIIRKPLDNMVTALATIFLVDITEPIWSDHNANEAAPFGIGRTNYLREKGSAEKNLIGQTRQIIGTGDPYPAAIASSQFLVFAP